MRKSIFIIIGIFFGVFLLVNLFFQDKHFDNPIEEAKFELLSNNPENAENILFKALSQDSLNIDIHYKIIQTHFSRSVNNEDNVTRNDQEIWDYYEELSESKNQEIVDIGLYGMGLIQVYLFNFEYALPLMNAVHNQRLKYLNNSIGNIYMVLDSTALAETYFQTEIENDGNLNGAYSNLIRLYYLQGKKDQLKEFLKQPDIKQYFPLKIERNIYFETFQPLQYAISLWERLFLTLNIWGVVAASLITGIWIMYLRKIDLYEVEKWKHVIAVVILGMIFSFFTSPLSDFNNLVFGFNLNGNWLNDLFYCILGIGAVEEFVKIIPLLLILRFTKAVNEPFDYILYASLSALGFAFIENLLYFDEGSLYVIHGRAMTAVVEHMCFSSIIAYGMILNKYKRTWNPYLNFLLFFGLAAAAHGMYDFWLINESVRSFSILSILILLSSLFVWNSMKNNALNNSNFFDKHKSINNNKLADYLIYSLAGVFLLEYIILSLKFGPSLSNANLSTSIYSGGFLIFFLSINLSKFSLVKGEWAPIRFSSRKEKINYGKTIDATLSIYPFTHNRYTDLYLPNTGKVIERVTVSKEPDWYIFKLDKPQHFDDFLTDKVLIRSKDREEQIAPGKNVIIAFYLIPKDLELVNAKLQRSQLVFCGWAVSK